jgi:hypothetical protein
VGEFSRRENYGEVTQTTQCTPNLAWSPDIPHCSKKGLNTISIFSDGLGRRRAEAANENPVIPGLGWRVGSGCLGSLENPSVHPAGTRAPLKLNP